MYINFGLPTEMCIEPRDCSVFHVRSIIQTYAIRNWGGIWAWLSIFRPTMLSHSTQKHKCFLLNGNCFLCANNNSVEKDSPARTECLCISESQYGVGFVHSDFKTNTNASRPQPLRVCVCMCCCMGSKTNLVVAGALLFWVNETNYLVSILSN